MFLFGKKNSSSSMDTVHSAKPETPTANSSAKVILSKAEDGLERHIVRLKKEKNIDLSTHRAKVFVVIDRSGSMDSLYRSGAVQDVLTRLLPLALKFDDNGELEVYVFNTRCTQMPSQYNCFVGISLYLLMITYILSIQQNISYKNCITIFVDEQLTHHELVKTKV